jgi:hypothetical protein
MSSPCGIDRAGSPLTDCFLHPILALQTLSIDEVSDEFAVHHRASSSLRGKLGRTVQPSNRQAISWEEIIEAIRGKDARFGAELLSFYDECRQFNRIQEPEIASRVQ